MSALSTCSPTVNFGPDIHAKRKMATWSETESDETDEPEEKMISLTILRDEYLNPAVNPSALGFLCIFVGGSAAHRDNLQQVIESGSDWDGLGIVETKADLITLMTTKRDDLCLMLGLDSIEGSIESWEAAVCGPYPWDVVSLSGWTPEGSNRAMKIWSKQHIDTIMLDTDVCTIGVLAHKFPRNIQTNHPTYGSGLFVSQACKVSEEISLRFEVDFIERQLSTSTAALRLASPALLCDLLLASRCVWEQHQGFGAVPKAQVLSKWLSRSQETTANNLLPQLYRWHTFPSSFKQWLAKWCQLPTNGGQVNKYDDDRNIVSRRKKRKIVVQETNCGHTQSGFQAVSFESLHGDQYKPIDLHEKPFWLQYSTLILSDGQYELEYSSKPVGNGLLLESIPRQAVLRILSSNQSHNVLEASSDSFTAELTALPLLHTFFHQDSIQTLVAVDGGRRRKFYAYSGGKLLLDIRIQYASQNNAKKVTSDLSSKPKEPFSFERWLVSIETRRAQDTLSAYHSSWSASNLSDVGKPPDRQIKPHFLYHRLQKDYWLSKIYGSGNAKFLVMDGQNNMPFETFLDIPIFIKGRHYGSLRRHLNRAKELLDSNASSFENLPTVFGLGNGHGGHVIVEDRMNKGTMPSLKYMTNGLSGFYSPIVDMAGSLYIDCFFPILFSDLWTANLSNGDNASGTKVDWKIDSDKITIEYDLEMALIDRSLATAKLEYILRPVFKLFREEKISEDTLTIMETTLGCGMLCCALLTRDFSQRPDLFFINLAVGIRLIEDLRGVFSEVFHWENWD